MVRSVFVEVADKVGGLSNLLLVNDIDLSYMDSMDTATTPQQQAMIAELYKRSEGGVIFMSGRSLAGIDKTFPGGYAASGEHHSVIRLEHGANPIALAPIVDTQMLADAATKLIGDKITLVSSPASVRELHGLQTVAFMEVKEFALAMVHSLDHDGVDNARGILKEVAQQVLRECGLETTHKFAVGNDAIEIVPKGLCPNSQAHGLLQASQIELLERGLHKGTAIHNFMSHDIFANRTPFVVGDSGTDGVAMIEAQKFGGGGIWVENGKDVPVDYQDAVNGFRIESFRHTWEHVAGLLDSERSRAPITHMTPANTTNVMGPFRQNNEPVAERGGRQMAAQATYDPS